VLIICTWFCCGLDLLQRAPGEKMLLPQVFSGTVEAIEKAVEQILPLKPALIDLNAGCPVPKIIRSGAGSALTREPRKLEAIVRELKRVSPVPVTVKIRSGWTEEEITFEEAALRAVDAGASLITLHPRTRAQGYSGKARWEYIARLREILPPEIPVIASGDLFNPEDIQKVITTTGCDGVMIARGATGNPFLFGAAINLMEGKPLPSPPSLSDRIRTAREHLDLCILLKGEALAVKEMRKQVHGYFTGFQGASLVRREIARACSREDYLLIFEQLENQPRTASTQIRSTIGNS